ncbi:MULTISPECIES: hypothetical protein [Cyanophyceae]|nr:hypothetical protein [Coleofasciculus sp. FACHB-125]
MTRLDLKNEFTDNYTLCNLCNFLRIVTLDATRWSLEAKRLSNG